MNHANKVVLEIDLNKVPKNDGNGILWMEKLYVALMLKDTNELPDGAICTSGMVSLQDDKALQQLAAFSEFIEWAELQVYMSKKAVHWSAWCSCDELSFIKFDELSVNPFNQEIKDLLKENDWKVQVGIGCCRIGETLFRGELACEVHTDVEEYQDREGVVLRLTQSPLTHVETKAIARRFKFTIPNVVTIRGKQVFA